jgi:hypothetical protein
LAEGIRRGYSGLYEANEAAHTLNSEELKGLVAQVSGTEEQMTKVIAGTFNALVKLADFNGQHVDAEPESNGKDEVKTDAPLVANPPASVPHAAKFHPEFRFNIEVHLPSNGTEETYLNIFNALRKALA